MAIELATDNPKFSIPFIMLAVASFAGFGATFVNNLTHQRGATVTQVDTLMLWAREGRKIQQDLIVAVTEVQEKTRDLYGAFFELSGGQKAMDSFKKKQNAYFEKLKRDAERFGPAAAATTQNNITRR